MDRILNTLKELQERFQSSTGSSSALQEVVFQAPKKINDYVYEVYKPTEGKRPSVEMVFFHGLQLEPMSLKDPHVMTWVSRDKSELWLNWLSEDFPDSRIFTISYDASPMRTEEQGMAGMYITCENLLHSFTGSGAHIGQDGCPVVLVGHCLGGLVMKELCVKANYILSLTPLDEPDEYVENFLDNVMGLFTYATPHHGSRLADTATNGQKGPLFENVEIHNKETQRGNEDFRRLRVKMNTSWKTFGVVETLDTTIGNFKGIVVPEASARHDVDGFYSIHADHFNVCRPVNKQGDGYRLLSDFINDVLDKDKARLATKIRLFPEFEIVGGEASADKIVQKLGQAPRLALVGFGGIGKTTLAKAVFDRISQNYDYVCFLDEVKSVMAKQETTDALRSTIVKGLKRRNRQVNSGFNWSRLKEKKVLIVLDDAELPSHVMVMTKEDGFSEGSRVIVTSRDAGFLRRLDFVQHDVEKLNLEDSKRLFCMHAFKQPKAPQGYEERVRSFVEKCSGLPLALRVAGSYLYPGNNKVKRSDLCDEMNEDERKEHLWDNAWKKLSEAKSLNGKDKDELWSILDMSYDSLALSEQAMFLDAATCFHGKKLRDVQEAWRRCTWASASAESGWRNLLDRCLVTESRDGMVSMHELLRDMGRRIADNSRMDVDLRAAKQLRDKVKEKLKILIIDGEYRGEGYSCTSDESDVVLSGLKELEILWLRNVSLSCMELQFQELRQLKVENPCRSRSSQKRLLKNFGLAQLQALEGLEIIQRFRMSKNELWDSHEELWNMSRSRQLSESDKDPLNDLIELMESVGKLGALRSLHISCDYLRDLPNMFSQLHKLEKLIIDQCSSLTELPESVGQLGALRSLDIKSCHSLRALPNTLWQLHKLEHLTIDQCISLEELPGSVGQLGALQSLHIKSCNYLRALPNTLGQLAKLKRLIIDQCRSLNELPESTCQLQSLQSLKILDCLNLAGLPESIGQLRSLQRLVIQGCGSLTVLPNSLGELQALQKLQALWIISCSQLETFPITEGQFQVLEELIIRDCPRVMIFPESIGHLRALQLLEITHRKNSMIHPNQLRQLPNLEKVTIHPDFQDLYRRTLPSVEVNIDHYDPDDTDHTDTDSDYGYD